MKKYLALLSCFAILGGILLFVHRHSNKIITTPTDTVSDSTSSATEPCGPYKDLESNGMVVCHFSLNETAPKLLLQFKATTTRVYRDRKELDAAIGGIQISEEESGNVLQTITPEPITKPYWTGSMFFLAEDMNMDGYTDFGLLTSATAGGNYQYEFWLYDPEKKLFFYNKSLRFITSPVIDLPSKTVLSHINGGGSLRYDETYRWEKDELVLIKKRTLYADDPAAEQLVCTYEERRDGKMEPMGTCKD